MITQEHEYYLRFILLLIQGGTEVLREIAAKALLKCNTTLKIFLSKNASVIQNTRDLSKKQKDILYPSSPTVVSDINDYDITLLSYLITNFLTGNLESNEKNAVDKIKEMRNVYHAHTHEAKMTVSTYIKEWNKLVRIICTVSQNLPAEKRNSLTEIMDSIENEQLDIKVVIDEIKKLDQTNDFFEYIKKSIDDLNQNIDARFSKIEKDILELKLKMENQGQKTKVVNTVRGQVTLSADDQETVDYAAEKLLLEASKDCVEQCQTEHNKQLKEKVKQFIEDVEKLDIKVEKVSKGSIIFEFKCFSLSALLDLITYFNSSKFKSRLREIAAALEDITGKKINVSGSPDIQSFQDIITKMKKKNYEKVVSVEMECTGVDGLLHAIEIFEEGKAANSLNELSTALSESVGKPVTLNTSIDIDQMQRAIDSIREEFDCSEYKDTIMNPSDRDGGKHTTDILTKTKMAYGKDFLFCDNHPDDLAQTICLKHNLLLCFTCALKEARQCEVNEIKSLDDAKSKILFDCLHAKQTVSRQLRLREEYLIKTQSQRDAFIKRVNEFYEEISDLLAEKKEKGIAKINDDSANALITIREQTTQLEKLQKQVIENIQMLTENAADNLGEIVKQMENVDKSLSKAIVVEPSFQEGTCIPNITLKETISKLETFGTFIVIPHKFIYDEICDNVYSGSKKDTDRNVIGDRVLENQEYSSSDVYASAKPKSGLANELNVKDGENDKKFQNDNVTASSRKKERTNEKSGKGGFRLFGKKKYKKPITDEEIYIDAPFSKRTSKSPKDWINKTMTLPDVKKEFSSPCQFTKLVSMGKDRIALFSKAHSVVVVVELDGRIVCKKKLDMTNDIVGIDNDHIAVLRGQSQIVKYRLVDTGFRTVGSSEQQLLGNVTGFDYDPERAMFALSSVSFIVTFDKLVKVVKKTQQTLQDSNNLDVMTTYDFANNCIYLLNRQNKTFKCYSHSISETTWKKRFDSTPNSLCLYRDVLCVTCDDVILSFSTAGEPIFRYEVSDLVEKCSAICVIDDIIICSSNSSNIEKSSELAFLKM